MHEIVEFDNVIAMKESSTNQNRLTELKSIAVKATTGFAIVAGLFGMFYATISWIDDRIDSRMNSKEFIARIASMVRPSVIIDGKGSVIADMGALQLLDDIIVTNVCENVKIVVYPKRLLPVAPIVMCIEHPLKIAKAERGRLLSWEITFVSSGFLSADKNKDSDRYSLSMTVPSTNTLYRIEIVN